MQPVTQAIREERKARADVRQAEYDKLSLQEKIERLPKTGATKQRARLRALVKDSKKTKTEVK